MKNEDPDRAATNVTVKDEIRLCMQYLIEIVELEREIDSLPEPSHESHGDILVGIWPFAEGEDVSDPTTYENSQVEEVMVSTTG